MSKKTGTGKTTLAYQANFIHKKADEVLESVINFQIIYLKINLGIIFLSIPKYNSDGLYVAFSNCTITPFLRFDAIFLNFELSKYSQNLW